jgi:hypothetical protein
MMMLADSILSAVKNSSINPFWKVKKPNEPKHVVSTAARLALRKAALLSGATAHP